MPIAFEPFELFAVHIHRDRNAWGNAPSWAIELRQMMAQLNTRQGNIMAAIDDFKAAFAGLVTQLDVNNAEIEDLLTKISAPGATDAQIADATQAIAALTAANKAEVDKAKAATGVVTPPTV